MRRKDLEIEDRAEIEAIITRATVCRLAMCSGDRPYVVPLSFGYRDNTLYLHTAMEGKKLEVLEENNRVCFEMDEDQGIEKRGDHAWEFAVKYRSVVGFGEASFIDDLSEKAAALDIFVEHYGVPPEEYPEALLEVTKVIKVEIESMTGRKSE
jgi:nitroimidazol reductase NimA-like FMN-containing flavoprotein (pyridoxamine 5'-phosphate oxidase superfamily)